MSHITQVPPISDQTYACASKQTYGEPNKRYSFTRCTFRPKDSFDSPSLQFENSYFDGCTFEGFQALESALSFRGCTFKNCRFIRSHFYGIDLTGATLEGCTLSNVCFRPIDNAGSLESLTVKNTRFEQVSVQQPFTTMTFQGRVQMDVATLQSFLTFHKTLPGRVALTALTPADCSDEVLHLLNAEIQSIDQRTHRYVPRDLEPQLFHHIHFRHISFALGTQLEKLTFDHCTHEYTDFRQTTWRDVTLTACLFRKIRFPEPPLGAAIGSAGLQKLLPGQEALSPKVFLALAPVLIAATTRYHTEGLVAFLCCLLDVYIQGSRWERFKKGAWNRHHIPDALAFRTELTTSTPPLTEARVLQRLQTHRTGSRGLFAGLMSFAHDYLNGWTPAEETYP